MRELHDLNEASFHLLLHLIEPNYTYFIGAGDVDQVIHSRLGAREEFMYRRFDEALRAVASYPLTHSFRHGPLLAYAAGSFKQKAAESLLPKASAISSCITTGAASAAPSKSSPACGAGRKPAMRRKAAPSSCANRTRPSPLKTP